MSNSKTFSTLLLGLFLGAAAGILLAPHKGSKTRKKILKAGGKLLDSARDKADELSSNIKEGLSFAKKETAEV